MLILDLYQFKVRSDSPVIPNEKKTLQQTHSDPTTVV